MKCNIYIYIKYVSVCIIYYIIHTHVCMYIYVHTCVYYILYTTHMCVVYIIHIIYYI